MRECVPLIIHNVRSARSSEALKMAGEGHVIAVVGSQYRLVNMLRYFATLCTIVLLFASLESDTLKSFVYQARDNRKTHVHTTEFYTSCFL